MEYSNNLRPEASPFDWERLTEQQKQAVKAIVKLLNEDLKDSDARPNTDSIDFDRKSRLAFIDGDRGTGKTSVLLKVLQILGSETLDIDSHPADVVELHRRRSRFKYLETLDMEPLAPSTNLLAAVFARILSVFDYNAKRGTGKLASPLDDLDPQERLADELNRLAQSAVLAWEGTDPKRSRSVDPTVFTKEVLDSERAGLELNRRLAKVLESLAKHLAGSDPKGPIFVLPVDDFDLAPGRCLELLRIVRTVSTPRLFFVIAGNTRIAERVLRFQSEGELARLAGSLAAGVEEPAIRRTAVEIAANNIRKLIPPRQRTRLAVLTAKQARSLTSGDKSGLEKELAGINICVNYRAWSREEACDSKVQPMISLKDQILPTEPYSGATWLEGTPRQVVDRVALLRGLKDDYGSDESQDRLLEILTEELAERIREDGHIAPETRETLLEVLDIGTVLQFNFSRRLTIRTEIGSSRTAINGRVRIECEYPSQHRWMVRPPNNDERETAGIELSRSVSGNLTFLHDLAISLFGGYVSNSVVYHSGWLYDPVTVRWGASSQELSINWHLPQWWSFREYERFVNRWEKYSSPQNCVTIDQHVQAWLRAILEILLDIPAREGEGASPAQIKECIDQLVAEHPVRVFRQYLRKSALVTAALVLCPESGCSEALAERLISGYGFLSRIEDELRRRIRGKRARDFAKHSPNRNQRLNLNEERLELLLAISPRAAAQLVWNRKPDVALQVRRTRKAIGTETERDQLIEEMNSGGPHATSLLKNLMSLKRFTVAEDSEMCAWIELMIQAKSTPFLSHPMNQYGEGSLSPEFDEIEQASDTARRHP